MTTRILLLTHCFPPYTFAESYLAAKKIGNLPNCETDVVTMQPFLPWVRADEQFAAYTKEKFNNITYIEPPSFYKFLPFHRCRALFSLPDAYRWLNHLYHHHIKNIQQYDFILTWSMYHSIHLIGHKIKKMHPKCRWVAHFSDPWIKNPYVKRNFISEKINANLERKVFTEADALIFTSQETIDLISPCYDAKTQQKMHVVPHCFDQTLYQIENGFKKKPNKYLIRYLGSFYGERNPKTLFEALKLLHEKTPILLENIAIECIGALESKHYLKEIAPLPADLISFKPPVNYLESLKLMKAADLLLLIDAPFENSPFLPSKLIDYFGAEKPVFGIVPNGCSKRIIEEAGFICADPKHPEEIAAKLAKVLIQAKAQNSEKRNIIASDKQEQVSLAFKEYSAENVGVKMNEIFLKLKET